MANFGDLNQYLDDVDVQFTFADTEYRESFDFKHVAAFKAYRADYTKRADEGDVTPWERAASHYIAVAKLFGAEFDPEAWEFRKLPKNHFINRMIADGATYEIIDRIVSGIWAKFEWNDEVAEGFVAAYDMGKAINQWVGSVTQETQTGAGETNEADSETSKD